MWYKIENPNNLGIRIWIRTIKIQIIYLESLKNVKDLDLTNPLKILNFLKCMDLK